MLGWRHSGFSAHNEVRVAAEDDEGRKKLAGKVSIDVAAAMARRFEAGEVCDALVVPPVQLRGKVTA